MRGRRMVVIDIRIKVGIKIYETEQEPSCKRQCCVSHAAGAAGVEEQETKTNAGREKEGESRCGGGRTDVEEKRRQEVPVAAS